MGEPARPRATLMRYLRVQSSFDAGLRRLLYRAAADVRAAIETQGTLSFSDTVRLSQLRATQSAILNTLWGEVGDAVLAGKSRVRTAAEDDGSITLRELLRSVEGIPRSAVDALVDGARKASHLAVERAAAREAGVARFQLSATVYKDAQLSVGAVDRLINSGLARNLNARSLAREVTRFIRPDVPGGVSYAALRLGRTELNNSFHAASTTYWDDSPFVEQMRWHLSGSHPKPDECNLYAERNGGLFATNEVPGKPHPQCLCYVTPVSLSDDEIVARYTRGEFDQFAARIAA